MGGNKIVINMLCKLDLSLLIVFLLKILLRTVVFLDNPLPKVAMKSEGIGLEIDCWLTDSFQYVV